MDTAKSREIYAKITDSLPEFSELGNRIYLSCYLGTVISEYRVKERFNEFYSGAAKTAQSIESILQESFEPLKVEGTQTPKTKTDETTNPLYSAFFHALSDEQLVFYAEMDSRSQGRKVFFHFALDLPLGQYLENTRNLISGIWPQVQNIEYSTPENYGDNFNDGYIILTNSSGESKNRIVATGYPALKKLDLDLKERQFRTIPNYK